MTTTTSTSLIEHPLVVDAADATDQHTISYNPATGEPIAAVRKQTNEEYNAQVARSVEVFKQWRMLPAPKRGEIVRRIGNAFREYEQQLGELVSLESGKILAEGIGEVVECIDIADFAVGLSRQLYGLTIASERPRHAMMEQWQPLGTIGIISAFNFPVAVWAWNAMLAAVCGDTMIWKPSSTTPLTAIAMTNVAHEVMRNQDIFTPEGCDPCDVFGLVFGSREEVGEPLLADKRIPLISATGSCKMGRRVGEVVGGRLARTLLELGGNNAIIIMEDADLDMVIRGTLFGAVGTAGQRCTSTRRLLCHESVVDEVTDRLIKAYSQVQIGDPLDTSTLMGPLINEYAIADMKAALEQAVSEGCEVLCGGLEGIERMADRPGNFVEPTIVRVPVGTTPAVTKEETFAPILYIFSVKDLDEAIEMHNAVDQGLSSAIFTNSMRNAGRFLSPEGSDCGIANINIGTSGAEIGGAFGGEKDTGGGRESGSDSWKVYMRRQTCTTNWSNEMPLAQGIKFG